MRPGIALVFALGLFGMTACGRVREVKACRALGQRVNPVLDDIAKRLSSDKGSRAYRDAAKSYDLLAKDLRQVPVGIPRLEKSVQDLASAMKEAGVQAAKVADGLEKKDAAMAASGRRDLGHLARLERAIVARIDADCSGD